VNGQQKCVLFVCIGNSCRSQMAEAFARTYGSDVIVPASAGLAAAHAIARDTVAAMEEKSIDLRDQFPKNLQHLARGHFDVIVNMSGEPLPGKWEARLIEWDIPDPIGMDYEEHCEVRDMIERKVMQLVLDLRKEQREVKWRGWGSER